MAAPRFQVYTKPNCGFCLQAKTLLDARGIGYKAVNLPTEHEQKAFIDSLGGAHRTFPAIFEINHAGVPFRFVGGFEALKTQLEEEASR